MSKSVLFVASVAKKHILQFHLPYIKWFKDRGYTVHVCAGNDFEPGENAVIPYCDKYYEVPFYRSPVSKWNIVSFFKLRKLVQENGYELVHCHTPVAAAIARYALRKERKHGLVVMYTAHGFHFYKGAPSTSKLYYLAEKFLSKYTDALITINEEDYEAAKKFCSKNSCKVYKIPGIGAQLDMVRGCTKSRSEMRREFRIPDDAFVVMSNSEINANKNILTSIKSVADNNGVYLFVCGTGVMMDECIDYAHTLGAADRIIFAGYRNDAKQLFNMADAFIFPSFREGLGMAAIEAMAAGLPIIVSDNRGTREYAVDGENAIVCDANDVTAFTEAVSRLAADRELCHKLGENGRKRAQEYDLPNAARKMEEIYIEYLKDGSAED